jgi:hypothetical protein
MGTTYKGLYLPSTSETAWTASINANFTTIADALALDRFVFLPASDGLSSADAAAANVGGTFPSAIAGFSLANAATSGAYWTFCMPADASDDVITIRPAWVPGSTDPAAHSVQWSVELKSIYASGVGSTVSAAGGTLTLTGVAAARTADTFVLETGTTTSTNRSAGDIIRLNLSRIGADAADTYVGSVKLVGVRIDYATG